MCIRDRGTPARGKTLEYVALDQHFLAATLEKVDFVCAELAEPFSQGCERMSAAKVYDNLVYALSINRLG